MMRQPGCCGHVGGTPTAAVETTALPICNGIVPAWPSPTPIRLAAEGYGKHKTVSQIVAIITLLIAESFDEWGRAAVIVFKPWVPVLARISLWVTVILTFTSGVLYLWRNRHLYLHDL